MYTVYSEDCEDCKRFNVSIICNCSKIDNEFAGRLKAR